MATTQTTLKGETMNNNTPKTERIATITKALKAMKVGNCGVKFDCLVWRVSTEAFAVGSTINIEETDDIETAANIVDSVRQRAEWDAEELTREMV